MGQGLPEFKPMKIVGRGVCEAGSPFDLDDGWFITDTTVYME